MENCAIPNKTISELPDIANSTNATSLLDLAVQYNLLAVGGVQVLAGVTTFTSSDSGSTMSFLNSAFGTLGVFVGLQKLFFKDSN